MSDLDTRVFLLELKVESNKTSEVMYAMKIAELETRVHNLEAVAHTPGLFPDAWDEKAMKRIKELEAKVESLTRTLDLWQEVIGIEVVITAQTHEGMCEKCDRVGQLNDGNICEGCFYEEAQHV